MRKRRPMMKARRNRPLTCSGVALVATSKSFGRRPDQQVAHRAADDVGLVARLLRASCTTLTARSSTQRRVDAVLGLRPLRRACRSGRAPLAGGGLPSSLSMNFLIMFEQLQDAPAALAGERVERRRRVGGHRVGRPLEQRQVVDRIAVDADARRSRPSRRPLRRQPLLRPARPCPRGTPACRDPPGDACRRRRARGATAISASMPNAAAIGAVMKSLVAVTSASQVAALRWCDAHQRRRRGPDRGAITSRMKRACAAASLAALRATQRRGGEVRCRRGCRARRPGTAA